MANTDIKSSRRSETVVREYGDIIERIRKIRESKQLSQKEFAEQLGMKVSSVGSIEAGYYSPSFTYIRSIRKRFGVSYEYIIDGTVELDLVTENLRMKEELKKAHEDIEILRISLRALNEKILASSS